ncbi:MAG: GNAT family N-acetyltransferase [Pseudomonadota bacterium]
MEARSLHLLSPAQHAVLNTLTVTPEQEVMGGSFEETLCAWKAGPSDQVLGVGFFLNAQPVGVTLFKRPPMSPSWVRMDAASIHGLKIAQPLQGQGWGHRAMSLALEALGSAWPDVRHLMLAVDASNIAALSVYRRAGLSDSGPVFQGPNGSEHRMEMTLPAPKPQSQEPDHADH